MVHVDNNDRARRLAPSDPLGFGFILINRTYMTVLHCVLVLNNFNHCVYSASQRSRSSDRGSMQARCYVHFQDKTFAYLTA